MTRFRVFLPALLLAVSVGPASGQTDRFEAFRRAATLGLEPVLLRVFADEERLAEIDGLAGDEPLRLDLDDDGRIDALAWREGSTRVVGLDEDGDLGPADRRPDRDSDAYVADLLANGSPDRLVDYHDLDGDGDPDRQDLYEITGGPLGLPGVGAIVVFDLDDDDRLFQTTDYSYHANRDMWGSDFDGDGLFLAAARDEETGRWRSLYENPFCFYDADGDGFSDEALRLAGENLRIESIRWSFDVDGDAGTHRRPDYDCSLTALGPVTAPESIADSIRMRDGATVRFVAREHARAFARWALWRSILFAWDEEDHNVAPTSEHPDRPRWEGVIPEGWRGFPAIGGPAHGPFNKRYELDRDGSGRMELYWSGIDERIHLAGAESGASRIHLPGDRPLHRRIAARDADDNGYFETWEWTAGGGEDRTRTVRLPDEAVRRLPTRLDSLRAFWTDALPAARDRARRDFDQLTRAIDWREPLPVDRWWREARARNAPLAVRAERSLEAERLLRDLVLLELGGGFLA
ncbi:MAG: hypothetical protein GF346_04305, partial [Candidatus Eisenbacteria bacterium]|nr:hypothetical protein [Candidatus Latescibacterota bacterium]MBD3301649.1 hypothetical protein [Candidatus Eisenbacteria bacterium]